MVKFKHNHMQKESDDKLNDKPERISLCQCREQLFCIKNDTLIE